MKRSVLKSALLIVVFCVAVPMFVAAGEKAADAKLDEVLGKLNLTEEQKTKIEACEAKFREYKQANQEKRKAARGETDSQKRREAVKNMREKHQEMMDGIRTVLTDEQKKKFEEAMPAQGARGDRGRKPGSKPSGAVVQ